MKLLFDLDGTLTDPFHGITRSISHALVKLGKPAPPMESLGWCIGPPLRESFSTLLGSDDPKDVDAALVMYRERFGTVGLFENEVYEDIPETLSTLQEIGHTLYVATSKPGVFAQRIIDHFGLGRYFKKVYGSELDGTRSDKASLISHIIQRESISCQRAVMIGDRKHDILGAKANGLLGLGVLWGYGTREELEASGASACLDHPKAIHTLLRTIERT
ncbi:MAG: HAD hydrolase-like protein [Proteobacteria bacterium]|nr:HAD hydrolase-like protein [Pseudomonadota bacterium]